MSMRLSRILLSALLLLLVSVPPALADEAGPASWTYDPNHSSVMFEIRHIFAPIPGFFDVSEAEIRLNSDAPEEGSVRVVMDAASVDTRVEQRNEHLRSADFLDVARFPTLTFESRRIEKRGEGLTAVGDLTIHGVTREVEIPFEWLGQKPNPMGEKQMVGGLVGGLTVNREDYGVGDPKWAAMGVIGREVKIRLYVELLRDK